MDRNINLMRITGNELREICDLSKIKKGELPSVFGISKGTLYNYFDLGDKPVPDDIEAIVDKHPELSEAKNRIVKRDDQVESAGPTKELLREMFDTVNQYAKSLMATNAELAENNRYFREVVQMAQAAGAIKYTFDKSKAITVSPKT